MKVQIERLRQALQLLKPAIPSKPSLEVLNHVRLGEGKVVATDLEVAVTVSGIGEPDAGEVMCLPYKLLVDLLASVPGHETAGITLDGKTATITTGRTQATLNARPGEDFPPNPDFTPEHEAAVDGDALVQSLTTVLPYAAKEQSRPVLTAVCLTLGESPEVSAADGFRLAWQPAPKLPGEGQLLIPARAVTVLAHLWRHAPKPPQLEGVADVAHLATAKRLVRVEYSQVRLRVNFGEVSLFTRLVEGTFPNYRQLIPQHTPSVTFNAADLMRAVKGVAAVAKEGSGIVRLSWGDGQLRLEASAEDVGTTSVTIPALCRREGRIAFNLAYLLDYLRDKDGMVTLATDGPNAPGLFSYRGVPHLVLMPMFVTDKAKPAATPNPGAEATPEEEPAAAAEPPPDQEPGVGEDDLPPAPEPTSTPVTVGKAKARRKKK